jgi:N4-gp56 family major capsid protein
MSNNYGDIDGQLAARFEKAALRHAEPIVVLGKGSKLVVQPKNATDTVKWRRVIPFAAATTPLTEGTAPAGTDFRYEEVESQLLQYGGFTPLTDVITDMHSAPILQDINRQNAEQAARTKEALMWGVLGAATNLIYTSDSVSVATVDSGIDYSSQATAVRTLLNNKAKMFTSIVSGGVKISTSPIEAAFLAFAHTDAQESIRAMADFVPVARYGSMKPVSPYEFGAVNNVRYITSPDLDSTPDVGELLATTPGNISTTGTRADVYTTIIVGMEAYGQVQLAGKGAFTPIVRAVGRPTDSDPLGQTGSMGWKCYSDELILNQDWIVAIKHAVAA